MAERKPIRCPNGCTWEEVNPGCAEHGDAKGVRIILPNGEGCYFVGDEAPTDFMRHSYWRLKDDGGRGRRLAGVTSISRTLDLSPDNLMRWAARENGKGISLLAGPVIRSLMAGEGSVAPDELAWLLTHEDIWKTLTEHDLTYEDIRDAAATRGTNVHRLAFQALAAGKPVPDYDELTDEERGYAEGVTAFWLDHDPQAEQVEQILVDTQAGVAGRTDFRGMLRRRCSDPTCPCKGVAAYGAGVIDAKTGGYINSSSHAQVAAYRYLCERQGWHTGWGALLQLGKDGTYDLIPAEAEPGAFADVLRAYRLAKDIDKRAYDTRKRREKVLEHAA